MIVVSHYGLHRLPGGVPALVQDLAQTGFVGAPAPVRVEGAGECPHALDLGCARRLLPADDVLADPLYRFLRPQWPSPDKAPRAAVLIDEDRVLRFRVLALMDMYAPRFSCFAPMAGLRMRACMREARKTNLMPLVLFGLTPARVALFDRILDTASQRPLLFIADERMPGAPAAPILSTRLNDLDESPFDWRAHGAWLTRRILEGWTDDGAP